MEMLDAVRRQVAASAGAKRNKTRKALEIKRPAYMSKKKPGKNIKGVGDLVSLFTKGGEK